MTMTKEQKKAGIEKKGHEKMMKVLAHKKDMTCGKLEASVKEQQVWHHLALALNPNPWP